MRRPQGLSRNGGAQQPHGWWADAQGEGKTPRPNFVARATKFGRAPKEASADTAIVGNRRRGLRRQEASDDALAASRREKLPRRMTARLWRPRAMSSLPSRASIWKLICAPSAWMTRVAQVTDAPNGVGARCRSSISI